MNIISFEYIFLNINIFFCKIKNKINKIIIILKNINYRLTPQ